MKKSITLYLPIFIIITGSSLITPFIYQEFTSNQKSIAESNFNKITNSLIDRTNNNITSLVNEMKILNRYFDQIYDRLSVGKKIHEPSLRSVVSIVNEISTFNIESIAFLRKIETIMELDQFVINANRLYNVSHLVPLDIDQFGSLIPYNNENLPGIFNFFFEPQDIQTLIPTTGLIDIRFITSPEQYSAHLTLEPNTYTPTETIHLIRSNETVSKLLTLMLIEEEWQILLIFTPQLFFTKFINLAEEENIIVNLYDQNTLLFTNNPKNVNKGELSYIIEEQYAIRTWRFEFFSTNDFDKQFKTNSEIIFLVVIIVFTIFLIFVTFIINYILAKKRKAEKKMYSESVKNTRNVAIVNKTMRSMIHEIKNSLNFPYAFLEMIDFVDIKKDDFKDIKSSLNDILNIINNVYDYDRLIMGEYKPNYKIINLKNYLYSFFKKIKAVNLICYYAVPININRVNIDTLHYNNIILNGINNAVRHSTGKIRIRFSTYEGWLLCEIYNEYNKPFISDKDLFLPFFMLNKDGTFNNEVWGESKDKLLTLDQEIYNNVKEHFIKSYDDFSKDKILFESKLNNSDPDIIGKDMKMGLSISRITAKALGGDVGLEYDSNLKMVRFWAAINYANIHNENENPDISIYVGERNPSIEIVSI